MAAKTFLQLVTDCLTQVDESSGSSSSTSRTIVKAGINEFYAEVAGIRDWETLENSTTVAASSGTMEYTPITASTSTPRIRRIQSIVDETNNVYLQEVKREQFEQNYPYVDTSSSNNLGKPYCWFHSGYTSARDVKFKVFLVPDSSITLRAYYLEEPVELVNDSDTPRIPDQFHYGLAYGGIAKYYEYREDPIATYYRGLMEDFKRKILSIEYDVSDEMPEIMPEGRKTTYIKGKIGRVYN